MKRLIAGQDSSPILKRELLALDKDDRNQLLRDAEMTIDIPPEQGLAMKADLAIPWNKLRVEQAESDSKACSQTLTQN